MKCEHCQQREAVVHITRIVQAIALTINLCEACSATDDQNGPSTSGWTDYGKGHVVFQCEDPTQQDPMK